MSLAWAVLSATAAAERSSPSQPLVLFRRFLDMDDEPSSVSRAGDGAAIASATSAVSPVVVICAVSGGSTDSSRLQGGARVGVEVVVGVEGREFSFLQGADAQIAKREWDEARSPGSVCHCGGGAWPGARAKRTHRKNLMRVDIQYVR